MKILIVDIETTGFSYEHDAIVEIGIVSLDLDTGEIVVLFDSPILEPHFEKKHKEAWIFLNSSLCIDDVKIAPTLEEVFPVVQKIFSDHCGLTAYNRGFDFNFLENRGFKLPPAFPCPMAVATDILKLKKKKGDAYKWPKLQEAWNFFFPDCPYVEKHRGADDARMEALIVNELHKRGEYLPQTKLESED